ncbi:MAG TPA: NAD(P)-binding protein [Alphaproteobacteria bacterium]
MARAEVVIVGGGVAGAVAAAALARAGRRVHLITSRRRQSLIEGRSERAADGFRFAGCTRALDVAGPWVERFSHWNGRRVQANGETLVDRARLDAALLDDARAAGAAVTVARIAALLPIKGGWRALARGGVEVEAALLIEARGRQAPAGTARRRHGPPATALVRRLRLARAIAPQSTVASFADGWLWLAAPGDGTAAVQVVVAGEALPPRRALEAFFSERIAGVPEVAELIAGAGPAGPLVARNADAVLCAPACGPGLIRIGDAAVAIDPLSGHGQFTAASTALNAVAVANTLLDRAGDRALAERFYGARIEETFLVQARVGRDFYRLERRWAARPFWAARTPWPDDAPAHPRPDAAPARIARLPVIDGGYVSEREVVVTADHARGVWQVDGVALVPLIRFLAGGWQDGGGLAAAAAAHLRCPRARVETALAWLARRGLLAARPMHPVADAGPRGGASA